MNVDTAKLAMAFEKWETYIRRSYILGDDKFLTPEQCLAMGVSEVSRERANYMMEILESCQTQS